MRAEFLRAIMPLELSAAKYRRTFLAFAAGLTAASFLTQMAWHAGLYSRRGIFRTFDVDAESSIPTWYSSLALAFAAALLILIVRELMAREETRDIPRWSTLAAGFAFMSIDEIAGFHEQAAKLLHMIGRFEGWLRYPWVILAIGAMIVLFPYFFDYLKRMEPRMRRQFIVAGLIFVGGAVGVQMIGARVRHEWGKDCVAYLACVHVEEFLEMAGIVLFNAALIEHLARLRGDAALSLRFVKG